MTRHSGIAEDTSVNFFGDNICTAINLRKTQQLDLDGM
jgi:hypothetical protein